MKSCKELINLRFVIYLPRIKQRSEMPQNNQAFIPGSGYGLQFSVNQEVLQYPGAGISRGTLVGVTLQIGEELALRYTPILPQLIAGNLSRLELARYHLGIHLEDFRHLSGREKTKAVFYFLVFHLPSLSILKGILKYFYVLFLPLGFFGRWKICAGSATLSP